MLEYNNVEEERAAPWFAHRRQVAVLVLVGGEVAPAQKSAVQAPLEKGLPHFDV